MVGRQAKRSSQARISNAYATALKTRQHAEVKLANANLPARTLVFISRPFDIL